MMAGQKKKIKNMQMAMLERPQNGQGRVSP